MTPAQLAKAYARVQKRYGLPEMRLATLAIQPRDIADHAEAWAALRDLAPREGWAQFQSKVVVITCAVLPEPEREWGYLLAAEGADARGRSFSLRQGPEGKPLLVIATPDAPGAKTYLADEVTHLGTGAARGPLCYRRYWSITGDMGPVPVFAAFIGFGPKEDA